MPPSYSAAERERVRSLLTAYLTAHLPSRLSRVDELLAAGLPEKELFARLEKRYAAERAAAARQRRRLTAFYETHSPKDVHKVQSILSRGTAEAVVFDALYEKYAVPLTERRFGTLGVSERRKRVAAFFDTRAASVSAETVEAETAAAMETDAPDETVLRVLRRKYGEAREERPDPTETPEEAAMEEAEAPRAALRRRLVDFYRRHCPDQMEEKVRYALSLSIDEDVLFASLHRRYGLEAAESSSQRSDGAPLDPNEAERRERIVEFYTRHSPENMEAKVQRAMSLCARVGEEELFRALHRQYHLDPNGPSASNADAPEGVEAPRCVLREVFVQLPQLRDAEVCPARIFATETQEPFLHTPTPAEQETVEQETVEEETVEEETVEEEMVEEETVEEEMVNEEMEEEEMVKQAEEMEMKTPPPPTLETTECERASNAEKRVTSPPLIEPNETLYVRRTHSFLGAEWVALHRGFPLEFQAALVSDLAAQCDCPPAELAVACCCAEDAVHAHLFIPSAALSESTAALSFPAASQLLSSRPVVGVGACVEVRCRFDRLRAALFRCAHDSQRALFARAVELDLLEHAGAFGATHMSLANRMALSRASGLRVHGDVCFPTDALAEGYAAALLGDGAVYCREGRRAYAALGGDPHDASVALLTPVLPENDAPKDRTGALECRESRLAAREKELAERMQRWQREGGVSTNGNEQRALRLAAEAKQWSTRH